MDYFAGVFVRAGLLVSMIFSFGAGVAEAAYLDPYPEYESMSESEPGSLDSAKKVDSEYQSDALTYAPSTWSDSFWLAREQAFELSNGSLSSHHFFDYHRLKLRKRILSGVDFKFVYLRQRDFEIDRVNAILELEARIAPRFFLALYGEPAFFKRQDDVGVAAIYRPRAGCEARAFYTWVDVTRRQLNDRVDNFIEGEEPASYGAVVRCLSAEGKQALGTGGRVDFRELLLAERWQLALRREPGVRWRFPNPGEDWRFERGLAQFEAISRLTDDAAFFVRAQWDQKWEAREALPGSTGVVNESLDKRRLQTLVGANWAPQNALWAYQLGFAWVDRRWDGASNGMVFHRNWVPHAWVFIPTVQRPWGSDRTDIGYESTFFRGEGDSSSRAEGAYNWAVEHRLNLRYEWALEEGAALSLLASFDLDKIHTGGRFEGGNAQFRISF